MCARFTHVWMKYQDHSSIEPVSDDIVQDEYFWIILLRKKLARSYNSDAKS